MSSEKASSSTSTATPNKKKNSNSSKNGKTGKSSSSNGNNQNGKDQQTNGDNKEGSNKKLFIMENYKETIRQLENGEPPLSILRFHTASADYKERYHPLLQRILQLLEDNNEPYDDNSLETPTASTTNQIEEIIFGSCLAHFGDPNLFDRLRRCVPILAPNIKKLSLTYVDDIMSKVMEIMKFEYPKLESFKLKLGDTFCVPDREEAVPFHLALCQFPNLLRFEGPIEWVPPIQQDNVPSTYFPNLVDLKLNFDAMETDDINNETDQNAVEVIRMLQKHNRCLKVFEISLVTVAGLWPLIDYLAAAPSLERLEIRFHGCGIGRAATSNTINGFAQALFSNPTLKNFRLIVDDHSISASPLDVKALLKMMEHNCVLENFRMDTDNGISIENFPIHQVKYYLKLNSLGRKNFFSGPNNSVSPPNRQQLVDAILKGKDDLDVVHYVVRTNPKLVEGMGNQNENNNNNTKKQDGEQVQRLKNDCKNLQSILAKRDKTIMELQERLDEAVQKFNQLSTSKSKSQIHQDQSNKLTKILMDHIKMLKSKPTPNGARSPGRRPPPPPPRRASSATASAFDGIYQDELVSILMDHVKFLKSNSSSTTEATAPVTLVSILMDYITELEEQSTAAAAAAAAASSSTTPREQSASATTTTAASTARRRRDDQSVEAPSTTRTTATLAGTAAVTPVNNKVTTSPKNGITDDHEDDDSNDNDSNDSQQQQPFKRRRLLE